MTAASDYRGGIIASRSRCRHARPHLPTVLSRSATAAASGGCPAAAGYWAIKPPSMTSSAPVTKEARRRRGTAPHRRPRLACRSGAAVSARSCRRARRRNSLFRVSDLRNSRRDRVHRRTPRLSFPCKFSCHNRQSLSVKQSRVKIGKYCLLMLGVMFLDFTISSRCF